MSTNKLIWDFISKICWLSIMLLVHSPRSITIWGTYNFLLFSHSDGWVKSSVWMKRFFHCSWSISIRKRDLVDYSLQQTQFSDKLWVKDNKKRERKIVWDSYKIWDEASEYGCKTAHIWTMSSIDKAHKNKGYTMCLRYFLLYEAKYEIWAKVWVCI